MRTLVAMAATGTLMLSGAGALTAELPSYELMGFPISPHQFSVLGSAPIKEQWPSPSLTMAGMPASPHQVSVLTPRPRLTGELAETSPIHSFSSR
jgi:hypothetical protein